jgi:hypothetical protein
MYKKYNTEINISGQEIIWYEENGFRYSFVKDPANSDYQRYLRWLENPDADETQGGMN